MCRQNNPLAVWPVLECGTWGEYYTHLYEILLRMSFIILQTLLNMDGMVLTALMITIISIQGPLLLVWNNFDPSMDKWFSYTTGREYRRE